MIQNKIQFIHRYNLFQTRNFERLLLPRHFRSLNNRIENQYWRDHTDVTGFCPLRLSWLRSSYFGKASRSISITSSYGGGRARTEEDDDITLMESPWNVNSMLLIYLLKLGQRNTSWFGHWESRSPWLFTTLIKCWFPKTVTSRVGWGFKWLVKFTWKLPNI